MGALRIAVVFSESLMLEGLAAFLREMQDMEVTSLDPSQPDAATRLRQLCPEVIIVDGEGVGQWPDLTLPQLLVGNPEAKLIDVNRHINQIAVYERHTVRVGTIDDLLATFGTRDSAREGEVDA